MRLLHGRIVRVRRIEPTRGASLDQFRLHFRAGLAMRGGFAEHRPRRDRAGHEND
jgi:hypothetical protein